MEVARLLEALELRLEPESMEAQAIIKRDQQLQQLFKLSSLPMLAALEELKKQAPDPKSAAVLVQLLDGVPTTLSDDQKLWYAAREAMRRHLDPRGLPGLKMLRDSGSVRFTNATTAKRFNSLINELLVQAEQLVGSKRGLKDEESEAIEQLIIQLQLPACSKPRHRIPISELWAAVYADPGSDEARLVLADCLMEAGDLRGEFIQLQVAAAHGMLENAGKKKARRLQMDWERLWLGKLSAVLVRQGACWERGFPVEGHLRAPSNTDSCKETTNAPEWLTFKRLAGFGPVEFMLAESLKNLESLTETQPQILLALAKEPLRPLKKIGFDPVNIEGTSENFLNRLVSGPGLQQVEEIDLLRARHEFFRNFKLLFKLKHLKKMQIRGLQNGLSELLQQLKSPGFPLEKLNIFFQELWFMAARADGLWTLTLHGAPSALNIRAIQAELAGIKEPVVDRVCYSATGNTSFWKGLEKLGVVVG